MIQSLCKGIVLALIPFCLVFAQNSARAEEGPVLTVLAAGSDAPTTWTMAELHALPAIEIETTTPFTEGLQRFVGVALRNVLGDVAPDAILSLRAVNDYVVEIPFAEVDDQFPIIAYERNGEAMSLRQNGPLWVMYPFDKKRDYQNELTYSRSIWQLVDIRVTP